MLQDLLCIMQTGVISQMVGVGVRVWVRAVDQYPVVWRLLLIDSRGLVGQGECRACKGRQEYVPILDGILQNLDCGLMDWTMDRMFDDHYPLILTAEGVSNS